MKIETSEVNKEKGIVRITTTDERWYAIKDEKTLETTYLPSVTWIAGFYPKGIAFYKWLANKGWDEAEAVKTSAGDKGSKVHNAIEALINGREVRMDDYFPNPSTNEPEELSVEEYDCIISFAEWFNKVKPKVLMKETTVISKQYGYAGTVDLVCEIDGEIYLIDFKTSQNLWTEYEIQLSAYRKALAEEYGINAQKLAILQVGYKRNKNAYKFTEIEDKFDLFLNARAIWEHDTAGQKPKQKDYPMSVKLEVNKQ